MLADAGLDCVGLLGAGISQTLPALQYISQESAKPCLLSSTFPAKGTYPGSPTHPLFVLPPSQIVGVLCKMLRCWLTIPADSALFWWVVPPSRIWKYPQNQQVSVILSGKPIVEVQQHSDLSWVVLTLYSCNCQTATARCGFFQSRDEK
jgi:hypothetical protein